ncbi:protein S40-6 [Typha latifolia]|uniref:protein S40-6 n=1 Tax=Typha latifolia TaxID=4733 RepID=UPI003C2AB5D9
MADGYGDEDFEEEEIWAAVSDKKDGSPNARKAKDLFSFSSNHRLLPSGSRMIPRTNANTESSSSRGVRQSAPVNIPDWSKIYQQKNTSEGYSYRSNHENDHGVDEEDGEGDDEDGDKVPPHEWLARKMARSQISSFSVCEGVGRTLKGRDLSKVRNAVLTRTGFLE